MCKKSGLLYSPLVYPTPQALYEIDYFVDPLLSNNQQITFVCFYYNQYS